MIKDQVVFFYSQNNYDYVIMLVVELYYLLTGDYYARNKENN